MSYPPSLFQHVIADFPLFPAPIPLCRSSGIPYVGNSAKAEQISAYMCTVPARGAGRRVFRVGSFLVADVRQGVGILPVRGVAALGIISLEPGSGVMHDEGIV